MRPFGRLQPTSRTTRPFAMILLKRGTKYLNDVSLPQPLHYSDAIAVRLNDTASTPEARAYDRNWTTPRDRNLQHTDNCCDMLQIAGAPHSLPQACCPSSHSVTGCSPKPTASTAADACELYPNALHHPQYNHLQYNWLHSPVSWFMRD